MFHSLAFGAAALDATAGDVQLAAVAEQLFQITSNRFRIPENYDLVASHLAGANLLRGRLVTPSWRLRGFPQLYPFGIALAPISRPPIMDFRRHSLKLRYDEDLEVQVTNSVAGSTSAMVLVTQQDLYQQPIPFDVRWVRFTATPTLVAFPAWSAPATITFQDAIDSGVYGVYGCAGIQTSGLYSRLIFNNQYMRPGFVMDAVAGNIPDSLFAGNLGMWGSFRNTVPPQVESLGSAAGAQAISGFMLISKIAEG